MKKTSVHDDSIEAIQFGLELFTEIKSPPFRKSRLKTRPYRNEVLFWKSKNLVLPSYLSYIEIL